MVGNCIPFTTNFNYFSQHNYYNNKAMPNTMFKQQ